MKYNEVCLADVCDLIAGYAFKSKDFGDFDDKVIKITHITPPIVDMNGLSGVDFSKYNREKLKRYIAKSGDYVLAMTGATIGKIGRIVSGEAYINQRVLLFKNKDAIDKDFLYYVLLQHDFEQYVYNHIDSESAQPNISATTIGKYIFSLPPMSIQQKIGRLLRSLDEKWEVNNAINHNLQQQAQALYQKMFCSMPHPDWQNGVLSDIAVVVMGQSPDGKSYNEDGIGTVFYQGRAEFGTRFPTQRLFTTEPKRMAQENDVLISVRAPVGDLNVAKEDCCIGRGLGAVRSKDGHQSFVLYTMFALRSQLNVFNGEGTVFGSINRDSLNSLPVIIPPITEINKFEALVAPMDKAIRTNYDEICHLQSLRDALLPRLMSGEINVSEVEL